MKEEVSATLQYPPKTFGGAGTEDGVDDTTAQMTEKPSRAPDIDVPLSLEAAQSAEINQLAKQDLMHELRIQEEVSRLHS